MWVKASLKTRPLSAPQPHTQHVLCLKTKIWRFAEAWSRSSSPCFVFCIDWDWVYEREGLFVQM